ncbi:TonB-dependent receptor [Massilibacteroides sp.]|uniref:TonB-dependent receptor domain-containing protein n=1 Tax=Massilibacteroides sp. TaxID=2034766 RepID=UPI00261D0596|nr:TonB-dependent receptor [Massilibacteroides sp.]MDD4516588.1 TonB-dependent receptor [Massilibacteroides sp.]
MKKTCCLIVLLLFAALSVHAQSDKAGSFIIKGQVVDSLTSETVPYATLSIVLATNPGKPVRLLASDVDGKFETTLNQPGSYVITTQSVGKAPGVKSFTLKEGEKTVNLGKLVMQEQNQRLGEVTVTAQKPLVKVEIDKLTYSLEDDPEAITSNTLDMLKKVPMVTVDGEDQIQLKGSSNYKIYLNGKPSTLLSGQNAADALKSMPANSIKNIEVITEPGAKYDAEGVGGIINIITNRNTLDGYTGTVRANASALGRLGGGGNISVKAGKFGLTANYNYNYNKSPWTDTESHQENKIGDKQYINQIGKSKHKGPFQFGSLEASYEIDTLNLLSLGVNLFNGNMTNKSEQDVESINPQNPQNDYSYRRYSEGENTFGSTDINLDYQHSTKKKDELLTISYKFSHSPDGSKSSTYLKDVVNYPYASIFPRKDDNDAYTDEHTGQIDYTTPLFKDHTLEAGVKYILRQNVSDADIRVFDDATQQWNQTSGSTNFDHIQHIYSGYAGYAIKYKKFGYKAGVRAEGTNVDVKFQNTPEQNFKTDYFDVVPSATVSYMLSMAQQIRLGYNMRIQRPSIWYLNPYINEQDPQNISYGNPYLDSEKSHNINMNYSMFSQKFNLNINGYYSFVNNAIERYTFINDANVYVSTFDNIGKRQNIGLYLYARWNPVPLFNITVNGGGGYVEYEAKSRNLKNDGFRANVYSNLQFNLPKDFRFSVYGGYYSPWIMLQGKGGSQYFTGLNLSKDFLKKKLTVTLAANSPFWKTLKYESNTEDETFKNKFINNWRTRDFSIRVSYTFGNLKGQIKKVRRGITNDDSKSGDSGSGGGGQSSPQ